MRKRYVKQNFQPPRAGNERRIVPFHERVKRFYPTARCGEDEAGVWFVYAMNGTGNTLSTSTLSEDDAWRRAWTAIERRKG